QGRGHGWARQRAPGRAVPAALTRRFEPANGDFETPAVEEPDRALVVLQQFEIGDRLLMLLCRALVLLLRRGDGGLGLRQLDLELAHAALPIEALLLARGEELAHEGGEPGLIDRAAGLAGDVAQRVALGLDD